MADFSLEKLDEMRFHLFWKWSLFLTQLSLDPNGTEDEKGIENSKVIVSKIIEEEIALGIDPSRWSIV